MTLLTNDEVIFKEDSIKYLIFKGDKYLGDFIKHKEEKEFIFIKEQENNKDLTNSIIKKCIKLFPSK